MAEQQEPLEGLADTRVNLVGKTSMQFEETPRIHDRVKFHVEAICTASGDEWTDNVGMRPTVRMKILSIEQQGELVKPDSTPSLFSVDHDDDTGDDPPALAQDGDD